MIAHTNKLTFFIIIFSFSLLIWIFQDAYAADASTESVNNTKYHNHKFDLGVRRFFLGPMYYAGDDSIPKHYKKYCFSSFFRCYDTSKYKDIIIDSYNSNVSNAAIVKLYNELREEAEKYDGYKPRAIEIVKYINDLLYYLKLKYKKRVKTASPSKKEKYEKLLQIVSSPKIKNLLRLTIPRLAESYYIFSYITNIDHSIDEVILSDLIGQANSILSLHNKN
ncbi:Plasmodium exported protein, unknown function [Plasmodium malariae]|uniref:Uncharacterized protein n=2 Tax=Plasmodium malariae TaxID=5858 RepID=A0A1D3JGV4_PLAMA|nr:Plasmodium exported protein, unknown function [Plasmodium malariae]SBT85500.1 Plasmodium exported protein, unknown function [Plasmodium malariae]